MILPAIVDDQEKEGEMRGEGSGKTCRAIYDRFRRDVLNWSTIKRYLLIIRQ